MKKLSSTKADLKKSVAYEKSVYIEEKLFVDASVIYEWLVTVIIKKVRKTMRTVIASHLLKQGLLFQNGVMSYNVL